MSNIIYVAISKETGGVMSGCNNQFAYGNKASLARSIGQSYGYTARQKGVAPKDLYDIHEIDVDKALASSPAQQLNPFVVHEIHSTNWNDEGHIEIGVDGRGVISIGSLSECPEDASLERDLNFVYDISDLLEEAHKAGAQGRPFVFTSEDEEEE